MDKKKVPKKSGLKPSMTIKNEKVKYYVYVLSNDQELTFKSKVFPSGPITQLQNGQLLIF